MSLLQIHAQSHGRFFEVSPEEIENTELAIEDAVGHILLELFDEESVEVDEVTVQFSPVSHKGQRDCSIHIQTQCSPESFKLAPCSEEYLRAVVATDVCSVLKEFFGSVTIESVSIQPSFTAVR